MFTAPDDGRVVDREGQSGVVAWHVSPHSPAANAGQRNDDRILAMNDVPMHSEIDVTKRLWRIGLWSIAHYRIERGGKQFEAQLVIQPAARPSSIENYLSFVGVLYLFIGLFIFARRWNATRAVHFYIFCLVSFVLYSFQYTGKLTASDWEIYWTAIVARLLQPALLLHFALVFPPERRPAASRGTDRVLFWRSHLRRAWTSAADASAGGTARTWFPCRRSRRAIPWTGWTWLVWAYIFCWRLSSSW